MKPTQFRHARFASSESHLQTLPFIHRFGSSHNEYVHFQLCAVDGVFEEMAGNADIQAAAPDSGFHPARTRRTELQWWRWHKPQRRTRQTTNRVGTAQTAGCKVLFSEDLNAGEVIAGVRLLDPFVLKV